MGRKNQAGKSIRKRLVDLELSVTDLAKQIGRPRPTVSTAIRTNKFPHVRQRIKEALGV